MWLSDRGAGVISKRVESMARSPSFTASVCGSSSEALVAKFAHRTACSPSNVTNVNAQTAQDLAATAHGPSAHGCPRASIFIDGFRSPWLRAWATLGP